MNPDFEELKDGAPAPDAQPADTQQTPPAATYFTAADSIPTPPRKKEKKPLTAGKVIALALSFSLLGSVIGSVVVNLLAGDPSIGFGSDSSTITEGERETSVIDIQTVDTSKIMTPAEVYAVNVNSTVGITTSVTTNFWGYQTTSAAAGSGFILTDDGYILTNHHVIEDSNSITVSFYDGTSAQATLVGQDASNDIAVLKVDAEDLTPVILGDSDNMNVGDDVVAIGNPLGELTFSLTAGTVSALDREITTSNGVAMNLIQTDCAINSGNSGGALLNLYGEVVGITNAKYSTSGNSEASIDNIGFAIPVNNVKDIITGIIENGYVSKPYIGISVGDVSQESQSYGLPQGAAVKVVNEDSPAKEAGLQVNDIITHMNGQEITGSSNLITAVRKCAVGDNVVLTVFRQGQTLEITVTVGETIQTAETQETPDASQQQESGGFQGFGSFPWNFDIFGG